MKNIFFTLILFGISFLGYSQKNNPVCGHAASIIDLMHKDYTSVDLSLYNDVFAKDRTRVIGIFRAYLSNDQQQNYSASSTGFQGLASEVVEYKKKLDSITKTVTNFRASLVSTKNGAQETALKNLKDAEANQLEFTTDYYDALYHRDIADLKGIEETFKDLDNAYLSEMVSRYLKAAQSIYEGKLTNSQTVNAASTTQKSIPFFGGNLTFETVIDGFSRFMVDRIKEEMTIYVIDKVQDWLRKEELAGLEELKVVLPSTTDYLMNFNADQIPSLVNEIKQYVEDDLNSMLENLPNLKHTSRVKLILDKHPDLELAFEGLELIPKIKKIQDPLDYFQLLDNSPTLKRWSSFSELESIAKFNISQTINATNMIANSLTYEVNGERKFVNTGFLNSYASEYEFFMLYIGMLLEQDRKYYNVRIQLKGKDKGVTPFVNQKEFDEVLKTLMVKLPPANISSMQSTRDFVLGEFLSISEQAEAVYQYGMEIKKASKRGDVVGMDTIHAFVESLIDMSANGITSVDTLLSHMLKEYGGLNSVELSEIGNLKLKERSAPYIQSVRTVNDLILDIHNEQYVPALLKAIEIPSKFSKSYKEEVDPYLNLASSIANLNSISSSDAWRLVSELALSDKKIKGKKIAENIIASLETLNIELLYIRNYVIANKGRGNLTNEIDSLRSGIFLLTSGTNTNKIKTDLFKKLVESSEFRKYAVSYYINEFTDDIRNTISTKLESPDFTPQDKTQFQRLYDATIDLAFEKFLLNQGRKANEETEELYFATRDALQHFINNYLLSTPERFDFEIHPDVRRVIHLVNGVIMSEDAEDVKRVFEQFALPSGSFAIKRRAPYNLSINSYPGLWFGWENEFGTTRWATSVGFTVPVGISSTWGGLGKRNNWSFGFFLPVLDVGAVTRLRFDGDNNTDVLPDFGWQDLFSPGLQLHFGLPNIPLAIQPFWQYGPRLKRIDPVSGESSASNTHRLGISLVLDIPLLNLYTKPK